MPAPRRKEPNLTVKLAAALCALTGKDGKRLIPHEHAKLMTAEQVISLYQFHHHPITHEAGGPAEHWNLDPRLIPDHREITAKETIPLTAKAKRVSRAHALHLAKMDAKIGGGRVIEPRRKRKIPSRPFQKTHRPLRSRNVLRRTKP